MNRVRIILVVVMSLLVGGVVFKVGSGQAAPNDPNDPWSNPPPPPSGPKPPKPPKAPKPPKPPKMNGFGSGGLSISIRGNKIHIDGLDQLVAGHLQGVRDFLQNHPNIPKDVRDKIVARMDRVKIIVDRNIKALDTSDLDKLDDQLEKMGDELEKAMQGLDADLSQLGDKIAKDVAKDIAKNLGKDFLKDITKQKFKFGPDPADSDDNDDNDSNGSNDSNDDSDDKDDEDGLPSSSADASDDDVRAAIDHLKNFSLKPNQKDAIAKLRAETDARVANEKRALEDASRRLETALADVKSTDAQISNYVDKISGHEAAIRKARLLSWVQARRVLDPDQIKQLEAATGKMP